MGVRPRMILEGERGRYTVGKLIDDEGGFSEIYSVSKREEKSNNRLLLRTSSLSTLPVSDDLVIKVSKLDNKKTNEEAARANIKNEMRIIERLHRKKGIDARSVVLIDHGERDGQLFLVLDKLPGQDLYEHFDSLVAPVGFSEFLLIATDVLLSIEAIHNLGIIHRDIKPRNIRYHSGEPYQRTTAFDFGIAMLDGEVLCDMPNERFLKCRSSGYSPPEADDSVSAASPTFDIYSVGAVMYCASTNRVPEPNPSAEGLHPRVEVLNFHRGLNDWIARCTHPSPSRRFSTAREAIDSLHSIEEPKTEPWATSPQRSPESQPETGRNIDLSGLTTTVHPLDLVLVIDSTESMDPFRKKIKEDVIDLSSILFKVFSNLKLTIVGLGDYESSDTLQFLSVSKHNELVKAVEQLNSVSGGGDDAEAYEFAFSALSRTDRHNEHEWRQNANHMIIVIGDSFSHAFPGKMPFIRGPGGTYNNVQYKEFLTGQFKTVEAEFERFCERHEMDKDREWDRFRKHDFTASDNWGAVQKGGVIIPTTNPLMILLHEDRDNPGNVYRPNIDKAIHGLREHHHVIIHTIHCGDSEISEKFFRYLSVRGEGVALKLDSAEDIVAILSALILTNDKSNYDWFVSQLDDQKTSLLRPATTMMLSKS